MDTEKIKNVKQPEKPHRGDLFDWQMR